MQSHDLTPIREEAIARQVEVFYGRARLDPLLGPVFEAAIDDWPPHLRDITDFWAGVLLGVRRYRGDPAAAHGRHPLTPAMFTRWLELWTATAQEIFEPEAAAIVAGRAEMIGRSLSARLFLGPGGALR